MTPPAQTFRARRDRTVAALNAMPHIACPTPEGAFYVFPSCQAVLGRTTPEGATIVDDTALCAHVLATEGLALVPGSAFAMPGHFRLSYAYSDAELAEGLSRLSRALERLAAPATKTTPPLRPNGAVLARDEGQYQCPCAERFSSG